MEQEPKLSKKDFANSKYALELIELTKQHIRYVTFYNFKKRVQKGDIKC